jgi:hypothetical protein
MVIGLYPLPFRIVTGSESFFWESKKFLKRERWTVNRFSEVPKERQEAERSARRKLMDTAFLSC